MFLDSLFLAFATGRKSDEGFGDWVARNGLEAVRTQQQQQRATLEASAPPSSETEKLVGAGSS